VANVARKKLYARIAIAATIIAVAVLYLMLTSWG